MPQPEQTTPLEYARRYAGVGFAVLPLHSMVDGACSCGQDCPSPGKHPHLRHGVDEASRDPLVIEAWFTRWPDANIGIATGPESGFFAIDVDPRNGGDETLEHLTSQHGQLPDTATAETGGGGLHYLFKWDDRRRPPGKLGKGVDVKGDGGYIVVEPSNHKSGKAYGWRADANPLEGGEIAAAPDWIFEASPAAAATGTLAGTGHLPPSRVLELRSALAYLDADDRDTWIRVGIALKSTSAPQAYGVWTEWSQQSEKFDPAGQRKTWATFNPESLNVESIFTWAQAAGWVNPASKVAQAFDQEAARDAELRAVQEKAAKDLEEALIVVDLQDLGTVTPPAPGYVISEIIPRGQATLLSAHGGVGKSTLGLILCAHVAAGRPWASFQCEPGRAMFVSLEDSGDLVKYRLHQVVKAYGLEAARVSARMIIADGTEGAGALFEEVSDYGIKRVAGTVVMDRLQKMAAGHDLIVIDNASDAFDASENERRFVRRFMRALIKMAKANKLAVLLLAHIDKNAAKYGANGNSYSGSTAWHNSARSRLALTDSKSGLQLVHEKSNYGRRAEPLALRLSETGVLEPVAPDQPQALALASVLTARADALEVQRAMERATSAGNTIPTARTGPNTTLHVLRNFNLPDYLSDKSATSRFWSAVDLLTREKRIVAEEHKTPNRKWVNRYRVL